MDPLYENAMNYIENSIRRGVYNVGDYLPTVDELAQQISCSLPTVRRAITELSRKGLLKGVQCKGCRILRYPSAGRVCLLLSRDHHSNQLLMEMLSEALYDVGYDLDLIPPIPDPDKVNGWFRRIAGSGTSPDCLVSLEFEGISNDYPELLQELNEIFPHRIKVEIDTFTQQTLDPKAQGASLVVIDLRQEVRLVMEYLLGLGHLNIAVFAGFSPDVRTYHTDAAELCQDIIEVSHGAFFPLYSELAGDKQLLHLIEKEHVTVFWDLNDHFAAQRLQMLQQHGIRVPEDIQLVGRHDTPWSREMRPKITTVSLNPEGMTQAVVTAVKNELAGQPPQVYQVAPYLVPRESTRPLMK